VARKINADCRADTRGGRWAGIPVCVIESAAYRALSLPARAILVQLTAALNGYNNGAIALSQRTLAQALGLTNYRKIISGIAELLDHGFLDISTEGQWKERQAREYRLTFVSTKSAAATNEYLQWHPPAKYRDTTAAADSAGSDATAVSGRRKFDATAASRIAQHRQKSAIPENRPDACVASLICNHTNPAEPEPLDSVVSANAPAGSPAATLTPAVIGRATETNEDALKVGHRLPDNFEMPLESIDWAMAERKWSRADAKSEAASFIDYWHAKPGKTAIKLDWPATWRVWARNAHRPPSSPSRRNGKPVLPIA
jgi:hypothetical protein